MAEENISLSTKSSSSSSSTSLYLSDMKEVKKVFDRFDANQDGKISSTELLGVLTALGSEISTSEVEKMMEEMDRDKDGVVTLSEFAEFCGKKVEGDETGSRELHDAFEMYDKDKNGLISATELHLVLSKLGEKCSVEDCVKMIGSVDADGDGNVSFEEFRKMMTTSSSSNNSKSK